MTPQLSMDEALVKKLTELVEENIKDENFGVKDLAGQASLSRSQLHRKLKAIRNQSISQFIREIRLKHAMNMLQNNAGTVADVAYDVGFKSPTYFNRCFRNYYGFPPGEARQKYSSETSSEEAMTPLKPIHPNKQNLITTVVVLFIFVVITMIVSITLLNNDNKNNERSTTNTISANKSIAILPFRNLSQEIENQYFADGMQEEILNHLSKFKDLKVISRTSSEKYRNTNKTIPEIAAELGVSYILEGSVQKQNGSVKVFIQLIDALKDNQIWTQNYLRDMQYIFEVQSEISLNIAQHLRSTISETKEEIIQKPPTRNMKAYNLYLQGRYFWNKHTQEDFKLSLSYYQQAIELDPDFALAFAGLADVFFSASRMNWYPPEEGYAIAKDLAEKALRLDSTLAEAHATLGAVACWNEMNWHKAKEEINQSLQLNPNYATGYFFNAQLMEITNQLPQAIEHLNKAIELEPLSPMMYCLKGRYLFNDGDFSNAIKEIRRSIELGDKTSAHIELFLIYLYIDNHSEAFNELEKYLTNIGANPSLFEEIKTNYITEGLHRAIHRLIQEEEKQDVVNSYFIAKLFILLENQERAIDWLENCYNDKVSFIYGINSDRFFKSLKNNPRFIALIDQLNLVDQQL
ncbi:helix-turn-helix domain-containing protein [Puteibacter caeruleilacunae]|nr:helix-turn-helix domain-containing protein [Puteibacter caeruleilacunae]